MRLVFLGAPGAGKGTIAKMLSTKFSWPHVSTGDAFRAIMEKDTLLAREVKDVVNSGQLVNDALTRKVVKARLKEENSFILDGYPRNLVQVKDLNEILAAKKQKLNAVVYFDVLKQELVSRLSARLTCKNGHVFNLTSNPPKTQGKCDYCGEALIQREDDKPEKVKKRLRVYEKQTKPLIEYYKEAGLLKTIKTSSISKVYTGVVKILKNLKKKEGIKGKLISCLL